MQIVILAFIIAMIAICGYLLLILTKKNSLLQSVNRRVEKIKKQASIAIPQAADYPLALGNDGARLIHEIRVHLENIDNVLSGLSDKEIDTETQEELKSFDFQQSIVQSEILLKELSTKIVAASKSASKIKLPKPFKNKRTIDSLEEVGLIDDRNSQSKMR